MRGWAALTVVALSLPASAFAASDRDKAACVDAHARSQVLRRQGNLRAAQERLYSCTRPSCPALVARDCTAWLDEVSAALPSVIVAAKTLVGQENASVRVLVDGQEVARSLDGRPIDVDPGEHVFRYERPDGRFIESKELIREGEKARVLHVDFTAAPGEPPARESGGSAGSAALTSSSSVGRVEAKRPLSPFVWVAGGIGVLALGSWAYFGLSGLAHESRLADGCKPRCSSSDVSTLQTQYTLADASLAVGVVSLGAAVVLAIVNAPRAAASHPLVAFWADFAHAGQGGAAGVSGRF